MMSPSNNRPRKRPRSSSPAAPPGKRQQAHATGGASPALPVRFSPLANANDQHDEYMDAAESIPSTPSTVEDRSPLSRINAARRENERKSTNPREERECKDCKKRRQMIFFQGTKKTVSRSCLVCKRMKPALQSMRNGNSTSDEILDELDVFLGGWKTSVLKHMDVLLTDKDVAQARQEFTDDARFLKQLGQEPSQKATSKKTTSITSPTKRASAVKARENIATSFVEYPSVDSQEPEFLGIAKTCKDCAKNRPEYYLWDSKKHKLTESCLFCRLKESLEKLQPKPALEDFELSVYRPMLQMAVESWVEDLNNHRVEVPQKHINEAYAEAKDVAEAYAETRIEEKVKAKSLRTSGEARGSQAQTPRSNNLERWVSRPAASSSGPQTNRSTAAAPSTPGSDANASIPRASRTPVPAASVAVAVPPSASTSGTPHSPPQAPITPAKSPRGNAAPIASPVAGSGKERAIDADEVFRQTKLLMEELDKGAESILPGTWKDIRDGIASRLNRADVRVAHANILEVRAASRKYTKGAAWFTWPADASP